MKTKTIDYALFFGVFALMIFWMIMISSVSVYPSFKVTNAMVVLWKLKESNNYFYLIRNISHVLISMLALFFFSKMDYKLLEKYAKHIFGWVIIFLIIVLFLWVRYNWAKGWINIPLVPFSIQPAEFLKLWLIIYLSYFVKRKKSSISDLFDWLIPFMITVSVIVFLLILQPDFGTILIIVPISIIILFVSWWNIKHLMSLFLLFAICTMGIYFVWKIAPWWDRNTFTYITERFDNFLRNNQSAIKDQTINFQTLQWLIAIWSWWFFWLWFWKSIQKFWYLPEVQWDFIFSVIWEELGFVWIMVLVWIYLFIWYRWFTISQNTQDPFGKYVALWITSLILTQAFINIWVNLNIVPLTGITLPFVSYWWSSLLSLMISIWILLNISRNMEVEKPKTSQNKFFRRNRVIINH